MSPSVLIIEDDDVLRDIYTLKFGMEGFRVIAAADGLEGLEKLAAEVPDLIVLDMLMPRLGGIEFLRKFRADHATAHTKIMVASNKSSTEMIAEAKQLGAVDYLIKSQLTPEEVVQHARKHLGDTETLPA